MCYFNQLGLPALIIHPVGEMGQPAGSKRGGSAVPLIKGFREKKQKGGKRYEKREKDEMQRDIMATTSALVVSCVYERVCVEYM